jgi:tRNA(Ile)-lysidine synthase
LPASTFTIEYLHAVLQSLPECEGYLVAYSGGMDSHVLLHSLNALRRNLNAGISVIHVNHGLSGYAPDWARHSRNVCEALGLPCEIVEIDARPPRGESPESWARRKRYDAFARRLGTGWMLLTAHHKDDQAETLLLQLFRGAGPAGLSAMPITQPFGSGWHGRPLLDYSRRELGEYAMRHGLQWIEDESNQDTGVDRNYIRHRIMPAVRRHWPGALEALARSARHQGEASALLDHLARTDLASLARGAKPVRLSIAGLVGLSIPRQKNLIRRWLQVLQLPRPTTAQLQRVVDDAIAAGSAARPCVSWPGVEVRRYRDYLYAGRPLDAHEPAQVISWDLAQPVAIAHGRLRAEPGVGNGVKASRCRRNQLEIRYRKGGETIRPVGRQHHHALKKLFQERGVPPWLRDRVPLLYSDGLLAAVPGMWIDHQFSADDDEPSWRITWEGQEDLLPAD